MATPKYTALATLTLSSAASSVTFGSIPAGYRDLYLVMNLTPTANLSPLVRFNNDTGSNYPAVMMRGSSSGATSASSTETAIYLGYSAENAGERGTHLFEVMDYSATDKHKTSLLRSNYRNATFVEGAAWRWANTAAVNTVAVFTSTSTFAAGSTFDLFGVK